MKLIRIAIPDKDNRTRGFPAMARRGRVVCLRDNQFIVPEPALAFLDSLNVSYDLIGEETEASVARALRDSLAAPV